jgi:hypothetical protein
MTQRKRTRDCARTRATHLEPFRTSPAADVEAGSTSCLSLGAPTDPTDGARAVQEEQLCLQAEVGA